MKNQAIKPHAFASRLGRDPESRVFEEVKTVHVILDGQGLMKITTGSVKLPGSPVIITAEDQPPTWTPSGKKAGLRSKDLAAHRRGCVRWSF